MENKIGNTMAKKRATRKKVALKKKAENSVGTHLLRLVVGSAILGFSYLTCDSLGSFNKPKSPIPILEQAEQKSEPTPTQEINVEDIIRRHAMIEDPHINEGAQGTWYIVPMHHAAPGRVRPDGTQEREKNVPEYVQNIQTDIYFLLRDLSKDANIKFVVGELVTGNRYTRPLQIVVAPKDEAKRQEYAALMRHRTTAPLYFARKPSDTGYEALEFLEPDRINLWILGEEEFEHKYRVANLAEQKGFDMMPKHSEELTHAEQIKRDPVGFMRRMDTAVDLMVASSKLSKETNDARSRYYTAAAPTLADYHKKQDFVFVTGRDHVQLMLDEYTSHRRVLVIRPKSDPVPLLKR
jgi:hypothetical protein